MGLKYYAYGFIIFLNLLIWGSIYSAKAHTTPSGWQYPSECCSERDCEPIPPGLVKRVETGWLFPNGEIFPFESDTEQQQVRESPDFQWHWCRHLESEENGVKVYSPRVIRPSYKDKRPCVFAPSAGG